MGELLTPFISDGSVCLCDMSIVRVTEKGRAGQGVSQGAHASPAGGETPAQRQKAGPLLDFLVAGSSRCGWQVFGTGWATMQRLLTTVEAFSFRALAAWAPALQAPQLRVCIGRPFPTTGPRGQRLLRAEGRRHPELARVWATSSVELSSFSARPGDRIAFSRAAQLPASP